MQRASLLSLPLLLAGLGLAACSDDPPPPSEVRARISSDLAHVLREASAAFVGGTEGIPGGAATSALERFLGTGVAESSTALRVRDAVARLAPRGAHGVRPADAPYDPAEDIAVLNERLFSDANYKGDGIYQIPASLVCAQTASDPDGDLEETIDPACAADLAEAQLRIRVSESGSQLRFSLQIGAEHDEPLTLGLEPRAISLTLDLDDTLRAAVALAKLAGEDLPNAAMAGQITGRLEIAGPAHAKATLDIDRAVSLAFARAGADLAGPDAYRFASAKAKVLAVDLDGAAKRGSIALGLGATSAHIIDGVEEASSDRVELDLPGLAGTASFAAGAPLELSGLSLGERTTKLSVNGAVAAAIDLNPDDGRALGARLSVDALGRETIEVTPKLDLRLAVDHGAAGDTAPVYDVTRVLLEGSLRSAGTDETEIVTGSLQIVTNPASYGFSATAGQCVTEEEAEDLPSGQLYTRWIVGACQ